MSEPLDRRTQKKAQTREQIRAIAHRLFDERGFDAVTIADVAKQAGVAVQTVFNHFATKEELFFDGRIDWVDGPADAVRSRGASVPPLTALREYLVDLAGSLVNSLALEERRRYVTTIEASDALRAEERENVFEAERRLQAALVEAWSGPQTRAPHGVDLSTVAGVTAALWLSGVRALVVEQRARLAAGVCPTELSVRVKSVAACLLTQLEASASLTELLAEPAGPAPADRTGWPPAAQRAG